MAADLSAHKPVAHTTCTHVFGLLLCFIEACNAERRCCDQLSSNISARDSSVSALHHIEGSAPDFPVVADKQASALLEHEGSEVLAIESDAQADSEVRAVAKATEDIETAARDLRQYFLKVQRHAQAAENKASREWKAASTKIAVFTQEQSRRAREELAKQLNSIEGKQCVSDMTEAMGCGLGRGLACSCHWSNRCYTRHMYAEERATQLINVGTCGSSVVVLVLKSIALFFGAFLSIIITRAALLNCSDKEDFPPPLPAAAFGNEAPPMDQDGADSEVSAADHFRETDHQEVQPSSDEEQTVQQG